MATTRSGDAPEGRDAATVAAIAAAVIGAVLTLAALGIYGSRAALSVAVGATIAVANLVTMSAIIRALLQRTNDDTPNDDTPSADAAPDPDPDAEPKEPIDHRAEGRRGGAAWGLFAALKILVLFGGIWILLTRGWVDPIPLVVGYGVLPIGIAASGLLTSLAPRRRSKKSVR